MDLEFSGRNHENRTLANIKELGLADNTLVFFCSDNGASEIPAGASNKPLHGWKGSFWEGGHRVPGIAWWPGRIPGGRTTDQTVLTMDLMPTCVELAGTKYPAEDTLDGASLVSLLLDNQPLSPRKLFWRKGTMSAMRDGPWKLLLDRGTVSLFDLGNDLSEEHDLATRQPERVTAMRAAIELWAKEVEAGNDTE